MTVEDAKKHVKNAEIWIGGKWWESWEGVEYSVQTKRERLRDSLPYLKHLAIMLQGQGFS